MRTIKEFLQDFLLSIFVLALPLIFLSYLTYALLTSIQVSLAVIVGVISSVNVLLLCLYAYRTAERREVILATKKEASAKEISAKLSEQEKSLNAKEQSLQSEKAALEKRYQLLSSRQAELSERSKALDGREASLNQEIQFESLKRLSASIRRQRLFSNSKLFKDFGSSKYYEDNPSLASALTESMQIFDPADISCTVAGVSGKEYRVTLDSCTCPDFTFRRKPCKHMYRLAIECGLLNNLNYEETKAQYAALLQQVHLLDAKKASFEKEKSAFTKDFQKAQQTALSSAPWLAVQIADIQYKSDLEASEYLRNKKQPALKASFQVRELAEVNRRLRVQAKALEYRIAYYEAMAPWLEDVSTEDAKEIYQHYTNGEGKVERDPVLTWISSAEYSSLSVSRRNQLALDRYKKRHKTNWEVGIDFERYIGYQYEKDGYKVDYTGATMGLNDLGRDLIAKGHEKTLIIQCKRWARDKVIREKHICQLYGSLKVYQYEHPCEVISGVFVCTCPISDTARRFASFLKIQIEESYPYISDYNYPLIKCNVSKTGEKIYHLPFDQQYDRVVIDPSKGELFAWDIAEAEKAGFRRAFRWHSSG